VIVSYHNIAIEVSRPDSSTTYTCTHTKISKAWKDSLNLIFGCYFLKSSSQRERLLGVAVGGEFLAHLLLGTDLQDLGALKLLSARLSHLQVVNGAQFLK